MTYEGERWVPCPFTNIHPAGVQMEVREKTKNLEQYICPQCGFLALFNVGFVAKTLGLEQDNNKKTQRKKVNAKTELKKLKKK